MTNGSAREFMFVIQGLIALYGLRSRRRLGTPVLLVAFTHYREEHRTQIINDTIIVINRNIIKKKFFFPFVKRPSVLILYIKNVHHIYYKNYIKLFFINCTVTIDINIYIELTNIDNSEAIVELNDYVVTITVVSDKQSTPSATCRVNTYE